jgi:hypothetical protein
MTYHTPQRPTDISLREAVNREVVLDDNHPLISIPYNRYLMTDTEINRLISDTKFAYREGNYSLTTRRILVKSEVTTRTR